MEENPCGIVAEPSPEGFTIQPEGETERVEENNMLRNKA